MPRGKLNGLISHPGRNSITPSCFLLNKPGKNSAKWVSWLERRLIPPTFVSDQSTSVMGLPRTWNEIVFSTYQSPITKNSLHFQYIFVPLSLYMWQWRPSLNQVIFCRIWIKRPSWPTVTKVVDTPSPHWAVDNPSLDILDRNLVINP